MNTKEIMIELIPAFLIIGFLSFILGWIYFITQDEHNNLQKILNEEKAHLDQIKNNCTTLGQWLIDNPNQLDLDPVLLEAKNIYTVHCK